MKDKTENRKSMLFAAVLSIVAITALVIVWQSMAPFLIDNDNIYLKTIASGEMTGTPEAHMYYMGFLSGLVLSTLYKITGNGIPWFGINLCICFSVPMVLFLYKALASVKKLWTGAVIFIVFICSYISFFYHYFARSQYTIATGFAAVGALFLLTLSDESKDIKKYLLSCIPFLILSAWSIGMRDKAFFMTIPFFGMVFVGKIITKEKKKIVNVIASGCIFLAVIFLVWMLDFLAYRSEDWQTFKDYTDVSETLFDYEGFPDYDENISLYEELGIKRSSYDAITKHYNIIMDPEVNGENFARLAEESAREREAAEPSMVKKFFGVLKTIVRYNLFEYQDRPVNILVYLLYLSVFVLALISKKYRALLDLLFIVVARMFDWTYLVWYGRFPFRVTQIIYMAELALLIALIIKYELWKLSVKKTDEEKTNVIKKIGVSPVFGIMLVLILAAGFRFGIPVMKKNYESIKGFREMSVCFSELEDYLFAHSENFYFFDMSHLYYMEDTLSFEKSEYENYVYMGSWMPKSPWYNNKMKEWGFDSPTEGLLERDNVYILYQQVDFDTRDFLDYWFEEHFPGSRIEVKDTFTSSNGFVYEVLKPTY